MNAHEAAMLAWLQAHGSHAISLPVYGGRGLRRRCNARPQLFVDTYHRLNPDGRTLCSIPATAVVIDRDAWSVRRVLGCDREAAMLTCPHSSGRECRRLSWSVYDGLMCRSTMQMWDRSRLRCRNRYPPGAARTEYVESSAGSLQSGAQRDSRQSRPVELKPARRHIFLTQWHP